MGTQNQGSLYQKEVAQLPKVFTMKTTKKNYNFVTLLSILMIVSPVLSFAKDRILFQQIGQRFQSAKAVCIDQLDRSASALTKQSQRYRTFLEADIIQDISRGKETLHIDRLASLGMLNTRGNRASAEIQTAKIAIEIKSLDHTVLSTSLYQWSDQFREDLNQLSLDNYEFSYIDQGPANCTLNGGNGFRSRCLFEAEISPNQLTEQLKYIQDKYPEYFAEGLMIEVLYHHLAYVDCTGRRSVAAISSKSAKPILNIQSSRRR